MRSSRGDAPAPFDVPCDDGVVGVLADDRSLTTVLAFTPGPARPGVTDLLPTDVVHRWRSGPDADAVDVRVFTQEAAIGGGPAGAAYRGLLGPLPLVAHRTVHLTIRFDARSAVAARYGTGGAGALRACRSVTRRLIAALGAAGVAARALPAAGITAAAAAIDPAEPTVYASRADEPVPLTGDGILVGAADDGSPVAMRLAGLPRCVVDGGTELAARLAVRLVATGSSCAVFTDRPQCWRPVVDAVGDRSLLHPAADGPADVLIDDRAGHRLGAVPGRTVLEIGAGTQSSEPVIREGSDGRLTVSGGGRRLTVAPVTTTAESALVRAPVVTGR
ncbi:MAG: type VII secretion protein EccE [Gordonia sp. (in: high G+C Gram-positive bacteria)]|uniref:type VII secretion protein EccE n=1 Tax=Gordonia sp. (in: high G+C Gram-positive bacteria) TaxID=84139 RepID=UPI0039E700D1